MKPLYKRSRTQLINLRRTARKRLLKSLDSPFGSCTYCGQTIVWHELLTLKVIEKTTVRVVWQDGKKQVSCAAATVDHAVSLAAGGSNRLNNLRAACFECNNALNHLEQVDSPTVDVRWVWKRKRKQGPNA